MNIILVWQEMQEEDRREARAKVAGAAAIAIIIVFCIAVLFLK